MGRPQGLRWRLADGSDDADHAQAALFAEEEFTERHVGRGEFRGMEFLHVNARSIINEVPRASRVPFRYTVNVYRGCSHACTYCFARPTHEYLGFNIGEDFERRIVVKVNAVERLRAELAARRWAGHHIAMGTNTDPYQRCEGKYHLTQGVVRVLADARNPFSILTKSTLILRDLDLLAEAAQRTDVTVNLSIGTLDDEVWRCSEPGTPPPRRRVEAVRRLNEAGVSCGVLVAPILPGLSDRPDQLEEVVTACVRGRGDIGCAGCSPPPSRRAGALFRLATHGPSRSGGGDEPALPDRLSPGSRAAGPGRAGDGDGGLRQIGELARRSGRSAGRARY